MPLSPEDSRAIDLIAGQLRPEARLLFVTGAGLSADSGLPTYRGIGGLYEGGLKTTHGFPIEDVLSGMMLQARPEITWTYLREIARASHGATFNRGHEVLAAMEGHFADVWVLTQNVDGFHRAAGSRQVIDIHGDLHRLICTRSRCDWSANVEAAEYVGMEIPPHCPECGAVIRPDVVLFGEMLPSEKFERFRRRLAEGFSAVFSVGTSSLFPYIEAPVYHAKSAGTPTVEINPGRTDLSDVVDVKLTARAAEALDAIWTRYQARHASAR
jgi:NAD-dependent deacetylase